MKHAALLELLRFPTVLCTVTDTEDSTPWVYSTAYIADRLKVLMLAEYYPAFLEEGTHLVKTCFTVTSPEYTEISSDAEADAYLGLRELFYAYC